MSILYYVYPRNENVDEADSRELLVAAKNPAHAAAIWRDYYEEQDEYRGDVLPIGSIEPICERLSIMKVERSGKSGAIGWYRKDVGGIVNEVGYVLRF